MPPKTKKAKTRAKGKQDVDEATLELQEKYDQALQRIDVLERTVVDKTGDIATLLGELKTYQAQLIRSKDEVDIERADRFDITADMTRQYKAMQDDLLGRIRKMEDDKTQLTCEMKALEGQLKGEIKEKETIIENQKQEIKQLKQQISDLSTEFSSILRETLNSISDKVGDKAFSASTMQLMEKARQQAGEPASGQV